MSHRIEVSPNNRAGCKDPVCKADKVKIKKGEIRMGVWIKIPDDHGGHGSWQWKHWGCVSGAQIVNLGKEIGQAKNGEYNWDMIDGWEDLGDHPDVQEKIKRVIKQGHIDPEDFKGDPEMNQPGQKGIRRRRKKVVAEAEGEGDDKADNENGEPTPKKATGKRGRGKKTEADDEEANEPEPPAKKAKRASKKKAEPVSEIKTEPGSEPEPEPEVKPKKATKGKRGAKAVVPVKEDSGEEAAPEPPKRTSGRAQKIKKEPTPEPESEPESEPKEEDEDEPTPKAKRGRKVVEKKPASAPKKRGRKSSA